MPEVIKEKVETLHVSDQCEYVHEKYTLDGAPQEYFYAKTKGCSLVVPLLDDGRLVLIRRYRYLSDKYSVEFPSTGVKNDESAVEAAQRELVEETGYKTSNLIKIADFEPDIKVLKDLTNLFIADELVQIDSSEPIEDKHEIVLRRIDEFDEMIRRGEVFNGQVLAAWALVRDNLLGKQ